jgi:hypothetical protein
LGVALAQTTKDAFELGTVNGQEYDLICRGLESLKKDLLDEASQFADQKLSYQKGDLRDITLLGRKRLEEVQAANRMQERWNAKFRKKSP